MATINIRIDDNLKMRAFSVLDELDISPSELIRQALQYVADKKKSPFKTTVELEDDDSDIIEIAKQRLANIQPVKVNLDDL